MRTTSRPLLLLWLVAIVGSTSGAAAQAPRAAAPTATEADPRPASLHAPGPARDHGDEPNRVRVVGLLQLQLAQRWADDTDGATVSISRARLGLAGSVISPDLRYLTVAELAGAEAKLFLLHVDYTLAGSGASVRVGRFKRPFSRPFLTNAGQLSLIDRPLTVGPAVFGDDVDLGVMLQDDGRGVVEYSVGVFRGSAALGTAERVHPVLAVRVGYRSERLGGHSESDLEGGGPRVGVAAAGLFDFGVDADEPPFASGLVDVVLKSHGFSLSSALYVGFRGQGAAGAGQRLGALGGYAQLGWVVAGRLEPTLRYAFLLPARGDDDQHDVAAGVNVFIRGHALVWQTAVSVRVRDGRAGEEAEVRLQSQLGLML